MDRKGQLANVAFGGAWSEQIAGNEAVEQAMRLVEAATREGARRDLRRDDSLRAALGLVAKAHPKGAMLMAAWNKALSMHDPGQRVPELMRIAGLLRANLSQ